MNVAEILLKAIHEEINSQDESTQAHVKACYDQIRAIYEANGDAGIMALSLLDAEELVKGQLTAFFEGLEP